MLKIALVFLLLLCGGVALSQEPPNTPEIKSEQQSSNGLKAKSDTTEQQKASNPSSMVVPQGHTNATEAEPKDKSHEGGNERTEFWPVLGYTLKITDTLLVVFTFLLFLATVALWWSTRRLVRGAESTSQRQLRAYVFPQNVESFWTADKVTEALIKWTFYPVWKNSGQTPTKNMMGCINTWVGEMPLPANFDFPDYEEAGRSRIAPGAIMNCGTLELTVAQLEKMRAGTTHAYVWGWAEYSDVFEQTPRHRTEFCFEIKVTGNPVYKTGGFSYPMHGPFNGYDEDCYRKPR